jgi:hypothetical protein
MGLIGSNSNQILVSDKQAFMVGTEEHLVRMLVQCSKFIV